MNRKTFQWLVVFIILSGMISLACNALSGGEEPAAEEPTIQVESVVSEEEPTAVPPEPTLAPAESEPTTAPVEPEPTATPPQESEPEEAAEADTAVAEEAQAKTLSVKNVTQPEDVNSYHMIMTMAISTTDETGTELNQSFQIDIATSKEPEAMSMNMSLEGIEGAEEFGGATMAQLDGVTYMAVPGLGCITSGDSGGFGEDDPFAEFSDASKFMEDIGDARYEGEEVINGIETLHYSFDETAIEDPDAEIEWVIGHIYVAKEGGWLVRMTMEGEGEFDQVGDEPQYGYLNMQIDITDINEPVEVTLPAGCDSEAGGGADWPMVEDAFEVSSFAGIFTYQSNLPFADVLDFYEETLTEDGWVQNSDESFVLEGTAILVYDRDGESINLSVVEEAGTVTVLIFSE